MRFLSALILVTCVSSVNAQATDEDEVITFSREEVIELMKMNICQTQSEQFGNIIRLRVETNSVAEIAFQCLLNGGFGNTDEGKAKYKIMQELTEYSVSKATPTDQCNYFSNLAFEVIKEPNLSEVDTWVQEGRNVWFKSCMENHSD